MALHSVLSSLAMRLDMAIDHLLAQGHSDLYVRLTQRDEDDLRRSISENPVSDVDRTDDTLKHGRYRGFPRSITDGPRSYIEFDKPATGRGRRAFIDEGLDAGTV